MAQGCGRRGGFSLIEGMIALTLFMIMVVALSSMTISSQRMAYQNVIQTAAYTVAQGFIEQIKSLPPSAIQRAVVDGTVPLETRSVSALADKISDVETDDWLYPNTGDRTTLANGLEVVNAKEVLIDLDVGGKDPRPVTMTMWFDVEIHPVDVSLGTAYLIDLEFAFEDRYARGTSRTVSAWARKGTRDYVERSETLRWSNGSSGRLQVLTSLMNAESLDTYLEETFGITPGGGAGGDGGDGGDNGADGGGVELGRN